MFDSSQYELLDFGQGRKLERFGPHVLDRVSPAAEGVTVQDRAAWPQATLRYRRTTGDRGHWLDAHGVRSNAPHAWTIVYRKFQLELKCTEFGHIGVFPEQASNWDWLDAQVRQHGPIKVLNLFAYTGGSTLAAAAAGAHVVHVDAAANTVAWARRNATLSGLKTAPIRWITEDARNFVQRELRRGNRYHAVILDPPSYGHGPKGQRWKLDEQFPQIIEECIALVAEDPKFLLLTCHSPGITPQVLQSLLNRHIEGFANIDAGDLSLTTCNGRELASGVYARWSAS